MGNDKTNMFVAIGLSLLVLLGWQYFVAGPRMEQQRQRLRAGGPDRRSRHRPVAGVRQRSPNHRRAQVLR
ncbi:hypothetical protein CTI14_19945, partial [Methylobacterium radiotolerans]